MIKHIIYRTTHKITGEYYIGLHKLNVLKPRKYWGTYWMHQPKSVRPHLVREILAEYPDRESARRAEPSWIEPHLGDPLCKNSHAIELSERLDRCDKPATRGTTGMKLSDEHLQSIIKANKGQPKSEEHRKKIGESRLGITPWNKGKSQPQSQVQCQYCGTIGGIMPMHRWHFDKCKKNPNRL